MPDVQQIFDWLVDGAPGAPDPPAVIQRMCDDLCLAGIPLDRFSAFVRTLHPEIMGRAFRWARGERVKVTTPSFTRLTERGYLDSVVAFVTKSGTTVRRRLGDPACPHDYLPLAEFAAEGITDYLCTPLKFLNGETHVVSFSTKHPQGFGDDHLEALLRVVRPLARVGEILAQRRTAVNLLDTYVGRDAGERIMSGTIRRGDIERIHAVIWFSDLRGFTTLAGSLSETEIIGVLNDLFDCQVPSIERYGGEVLKFMGDGLLAIFPVGIMSKSLGAVCDAAFDAAEGALNALAKLNSARAERGEVAIRFGLALHIGVVAYGNIGGANRLDFTCIGSAVNVASRLEGLTGRIERPVVVSAEVAKLTKRRLVPIGAFELKGVAGAQEVFAPEEAPLASW
jgi:adenylate cyclase